MLFFDLQSVDQAIKEITAFLATTLFSRSENISLIEADNRVLAEPVQATEDVPNYCKSTVDGYAVRAVDTDGASGSVPAMMRLIGEIHMGEHVQTRLKAGETMIIPTGGMLPPGADTVVMVEDSEAHLDDIYFSRSLAPGMHTIDIGEDIRAGQCLFPVRTRLTPPKIGALASLSTTTIKAYERPRFAIISTGDEIRPVHQPLRIGQIRDSNAFVLASQIGRLGGDLVFSDIVGDDKTDLKVAVESGIHNSNIVLVSGGSSVGERDYTKTIFSDLPDSRIAVHGLAAKPGKPTLVAMSGDTLLLGLPGHPASCSLIFQELMFASFYRLGLISKGPAPLSARLLEHCHGSPGRRTYQTVTLNRDGNEVVCRPLRGQSGLVSLLASGSGYFVIDENTEGVKAGTSVFVYSLEGGFHG